MMYLRYAIVFLCFSSGVFANVSPLQLSLFSPVQVMDPSYDIYGLRLNLMYGDNLKVYGLDLGLTGKIQKGAGWQYNVLWNEVDETYYGLQTGLLNRAYEMNGLQLGLANITNTSVFQIGAFNMDHSDSIVQLGLVNIADHSHVQISGFNFQYKMEGMQLGLLNTSGYEMRGFQLGAVNVNKFSRGFLFGAVNVSRVHEGVQFGLINYTKSLSGVQIGLINIHRDSAYPFMILIRPASDSYRPEAPVCDSRSCKP